jgi:hypothetical protein
MPRTSEELAVWLKEHCGPFPYGDHISLPKKETDETWLKLGADLHEFIESGPSSES